MTFEEAKAELEYAIQPDGSLYCLATYVSWKPGESIKLDSEYLWPHDLLAIAIYTMEIEKQQGIRRL